MSRQNPFIPGTTPTAAPQIPLGNAFSHSDNKKDSSRSLSVNSAASRGKEEEDSTVYTGSLQPRRFKGEKPNAPAAIEDPAATALPRFMMAKYKTNRTLLYLTFIMELAYLSFAVYTGKKGLTQVDKEIFGDMVPEVAEWIFSVATGVLDYYVNCNAIRPSADAREALQLELTEDGKLVMKTIDPATVDPTPEPGYAKRILIVYPAMAAMFTNFFIGSAMNILGVVPAMDAVMAWLVLKGVMQTGSGVNLELKIFKWFFSAFQIPTGIAYYFALSKADIESAIKQLCNFSMSAVATVARQTKAGLVDASVIGILQTIVRGASFGYGADGLYKLFGGIIAGHELQTSGWDKLPWAIGTWSGAHVAIFTRAISHFKMLANPFTPNLVVDRMIPRAEFADSVNHFRPYAKKEYPYSALLGPAAYTLLQGGFSGWFVHSLLSYALPTEARTAGAIAGAIAVSAPLAAITFASGRNHAINTTARELRDKQSSTKNGQLRVILTQLDTIQSPNYTGNKVIEIKKLQTALKELVQKEEKATSQSGQGISTKHRVIAAFANFGSQANRTMGNVEFLVGLMLLPMMVAILRPAEHNADEQSAVRYATLVLAFWWAALVQLSNFIYMQPKVEVGTQNFASLFTCCGGSKAEATAQDAEETNPLLKTQFGQELVFVKSKLEAALEVANNPRVIELDADAPASSTSSYTYTG